MSNESELTREDQNRQVFQPQDTAPAAQPTPQPQHQSNEMQTTGYETPVESVAIPSAGMVYSLDNPLCNETTVEIKCMTATHEDLLTSPALIKNGTVLSKLLEACIVNRTVDASTMLSGDRNAILIALRITGYGAKYDVDIFCGECGVEYEAAFDLSNLALKTLSAAPLQPNMNLFEFTLPVSGRTVHFKLLTGADERELANDASRRKKVIKSQTENIITSRLTKSVVSIGGDTDLAKISQAIKNMPAGDSRALRNYMDKIEPSVDMTQVTKCTSCGEHSEVTVPMGLTFFWPDAGK